MTGTAEEKHRRFTKQSTATSGPKNSNHKELLVSIFKSKKKHLSAIFVGADPLWSIVMQRFTCLAPVIKHLPPPPPITTNNLRRQLLQRLRHSYPREPP